MKINPDVLIITFIYLVVCAIALSGCVAYQNVKAYERIDNEVVLTKQVKAIIFGTSGQKIKAIEVEIEKNDASDKAVTLVQTGISTAKDIAISRSDEVIE